MRVTRRTLPLALASLLALPALPALPAPASAQTFRTNDPTMRRIWQVGMDSSQVERFAGVLIDSIGPRLSGTAGYAGAVTWLERVYQGLGVSVRRHQYGTWRPWRAGAVHLDLLAPHVRTMEARLLAWSPGNGGRPTDGDVIAPPSDTSPAGVSAWLRGARGKFVLMSAPEPTCRAPQELERNARPATVQRLAAQRNELARTFQRRITALAPAGTPAGGVTRAIYARLDSAGVAGVLTSQWSNGWGVNKVFASNTERVPSLDVSCEDYGLMWRLAERGQGPRARLSADATTGGPEAPMFNVVAELKGTEKPDEYVLLSAHLDSWASAQGATDNGTGTLTMLEAMRILKAAYPNPKRTILVGHWGGEEQGMNGSLAFAEDHPDVLRGMQSVFNQDNGTWRFELLEGQGFIGAAPNLARWMSQLPTEFSDSLRLQVPGPQANSGSDHSAFVCRQVPAFRLQSPYAEYRQYTWHTNRDTFDKIVFDDLRQNATIAAMMAYAASEDPTRTGRETALLPVFAGGGAAGSRPWPTCNRARRSYQESVRR
jgi:carboxypeptidase Q